MDFIVANGLTNDLWLYPGNGDGTFQVPQVIPLSKGLTPVALATASFRNNGVLDLVVAEFDSATIGVLLGNGDGTFGYETEYALPEPPESVVIDDFNHDGKLSIAAAMPTDITPPTTQIPYVALLSGDGTGKFSAPTISYVPYFENTIWNIASGDVNGDGLPDVLMTGPGWEDSKIYLNNGDGTFTLGQTVMANGEYDTLLDGRLGDVNGDGCADAVVADVFTVVWVAYGDCKGGFATPIAVLMGVNNGSVRLADLNGDGHLDLVTTAFQGFSGAGLGMFGGDTISVALGDGKGNFAPPRQYTGSGQAYSITAADFTGSGKIDLVTPESDTDTVTVYANDGTGSFGSPEGVFAGVPGQGVEDAPFSALSFADLNKDGHPDAFVLDEGYNGEFYATSFLNDGSGRFSGPIASDTGIGISPNWVGDYRLGDFRNSGKLDLLAIGQDASLTSSNQFVLFAKGNGDGTFAKGTIVQSAGADGILTTGDFNHDGKLDFAAVNGNPTHTVTVFLGNGDGTFRGLAPFTFTDSLIGEGGEMPYRFYAGDFNRDGKLDLLVFTSGNGYWTIGSSVWEIDGNGDGTFQTPQRIFTEFQPFVMADVNGDGYPDIARYDFMWPDGTSETAGPAKFTTYLDQADGSFAKASSYAPYSGVPASLQPQFQNGDPMNSSLVGVYSTGGKPDEVAFQTAPGTGGDWYQAQILMGKGDGTFTPTYDVFPFAGGYPLYAADLTGKGVSDMVELDSGTSSLRVFHGGAAPSLQLVLEEPVVTGDQGCGWVFPDLAMNSSQTVTLSTMASGVTLPGTVTVPAGAQSARFCYNLANNFNWHQVIDIHATLNGTTATSYAAASYVIGFSEAISDVTPPAVYQGQSSAPLTVTLAAQPGYSSTANLSCEGLSQGDSCLFATTTLAVSPSGPASTTVTLVTAANAAEFGNSRNFTIVANDGNVIQRQTVTLGVAQLLISSLSSTLPMLSPGSASLTFSMSGIPPYQFECSGLPAGASCAFSGSQAPFPALSGITLGVNLPSGIAAGTYPITVSASSQANTASAVIAMQVETYSVQGPPTGNNWIFPGTTQSIPVTVQGSPNWSGGQPVTLGCSLDITATCTGLSVVPGSATVDLTLSIPANTAAGAHQLTVTASFSGSTQTYTFPVYVVSLSGSLGSNVLSMSRGGTANLTATLKASTGFTGNVALACSGASQLSCSVNPANSLVAGGTPQSYTITVTAGANAMLEQSPAESSAPKMLALAGLFPLAICCGALRRRWRNLALLLILGGVLFTTITACGGGGSGGSGGGGGGSETYSLTVTATPSGTTATTQMGIVTVTVTH